MQKFIWTIAAIAIITSAPMANAASASKEETIGVGAGGIVGAVAGGPVGFIIGAAVGAKIGDTLHTQKDEIETLNASLEVSAASVDDLRVHVDSMAAELAELERRSMPELVELLDAGIAMDLLFRTDEYVLADPAGERFADLGAKLAGLPKLQIRLDGFADERGASSYNQKLSEKRVNYVRDALVAAGVDPSRIGVAAHGESEAVDDTPDSLALERRVSVSLFIGDTPAFAANPE